MKHKKYTKGRHTYTRWGNVTEVRNDDSPGMAVEIDEATAEVYANSFQVTGRPEALHLRFTKIIPPIEKVYDAVTAVLSFEAARKLAKDLERMLKNVG